MGKFFGLRHLLGRRGAKKGRGILTSCKLGRFRRHEHHCVIRAKEKETLVLR